MATPHCKVLNGVLTSKSQSKSPIEGRNEVWKQPRTPSPEWSTTIKKILLYFYSIGGFCRSQIKSCEYPRKVLEFRNVTFVLSGLWSDASFNHGDSRSLSVQRYGSGRAKVKPPSNICKPNLSNISMPIRFAG